MRVYKFLPANWALKDIRERKLKIATFDDLNDPFELWPIDLSNPEIREIFRRFKQGMARMLGFLSFSRIWKEPLLWAHYAENHKGICLGFDNWDDDPEGKRSLMNVHYVEDRKNYDERIRALEHQPIEERDKFSKMLLGKKYKGWEYEKEVRGFANLDERDLCTGFYFKDFDESIKLKEVITGPRCEEENLKKIEELISGYAEPPKVIKTRLAYNSFEVVEDGCGFAEAQ